MKVRNPFFIKGYHGPEYFCDRVQETERLLAAIRNGRDVTLMAPRRYGKTGLIHNVFARLEKDFVPIYLDIFQMRSLAEFTRAFSANQKKSKKLNLVLQKCRRQNAQNL